MKCDYHFRGFSTKKNNLEKNTKNFKDKISLKKTFYFKIYEKDFYFLKNKVDS